MDDRFPRLSRKEFDILKYLVDKGGERYGLEMVEDSGGTLKKGTVYVTLTGYREDDFASYVYRSTDYGRTWVSITSNLPSESVNVIAEDPLNANILFIGTDLGCYVSIDDGKRWESLCHTLPTTPVHDLFVHPRDPVLVIGTHGRSVFTLDVRKIRSPTHRPLP